MLTARRPLAPCPPELIPFDTRLLAKMWKHGPEELQEYCLAIFKMHTFGLTDPWHFTYDRHGPFYASVRPTSGDLDKLLLLPRHVDLWHQVG